MATAIEQTIKGKKLLESQKKAVMQV